MQNLPDIGLMDTAKAVFYITEGGFAGLRYNGTDYPHITLRRTLPIKEPTRYISVADNENNEIGIIQDVAALAATQQKVVLDELEARYYSPQVLEIISVKDKMGYVYFELKLQNKPTAEGADFHIKTCAVKDVSRNVRMLSDTRLIILDVDGNRYIVDLPGMDKHSVKRLDPYLF